MFKGTGRSNPTVYLEGETFRNIGQPSNDCCVLQKSTPCFAHEVACLKASCWVCRSLPGTWSLGDELQPRSAGVHGSLPDPRPLPEPENKSSCLETQLFLQAVRTHEEERCIPSEILTNIQGLQSSKVLSSSTHPLIDSFTQQI